ncbi:UNVERIFIED_CONTAM: hypothetical protein PYX00_003281 [Menopon gallinae]|uniref:Uncharacterized protein n=1 Tax=Menopon gallinae TaxID=328185 RepID=A0AAW2I148_9NEOP
MTHQKYKERLIPKQNKGLIGGICLCQLTVVLSLVAFIYLSVAIYIPSYRAFNAGFDPTPVMCQTVETTMINNCSWASCGEWCLTKTTGFCPQIQVTVRRNGTNMEMKNCSRLNTYACLQAKPENLHRYNCNNGTECSNLSGLFNCSLGHCANMSEIFLCTYKADGVVIDSEKDNMKLNGFFECKHTRCTKIKRAFSCDRYCNTITTTGMNTYIMYDNYVYVGDCQKAVTSDDPATEIWSKDRSDKILMASCTTVDRVDSRNLRATDCLNGTLLPKSGVPKVSMNFTTLWSIYEKSNESVDAEHRFIPQQRTLTIYNLSQLYINLEGCVNTLKGECKEFLATHGRDGRNKTAQSRFPCYYNKENSARAVARFDLEKTRRELLIALIVPSVLFVISLTTLMVITRSVKVGDDTVL